MGAPRRDRPRWLGTLLAACLATLPAISACPRPCACRGSAELHCTFRYFTAVPPRIPPGVQRINLGYNSLRKLSPTDFAGLEKLELLMLHSNEISTIPEKVFSDLRSLQVLKMSYNKVRELQQDVFYGLNSLVRLHMDHNQIEFVNPSVFYGLTSLRLVHLDGNLLQQLHPDTFVTLRYSQIFRVSFLKHISLSDNMLTSLPREMFSYMSELESIYLHGNPWSCDCSLQGFAEWAQDRPDVIKCRKERSSSVQQCPVCASPKNHNGKSLVDLPSASFTCSKPVIHDSLKSRDLMVPEDGDFSFVSPKDLIAPIGSVVLNMTDQAGNRGDLVCDVQKPEEMSPVSFDKNGSSTVLKASFSAFLVCGIDPGHIQQLWSILALYSNSPLNLERTVRTADVPFTGYQYKQVHSEKDELFTDVEAAVRAEPGWLMQSRVSLQLDRTATTLSTLHVRYSTHARIGVPGGGRNQERPNWAIIARDNGTRTEHTVLVGGSVELGCRAAGRPAPAVQWILADGSRVPAPHVSEDGRILVLESGALTLRAADVFDTGLYRCIGTNRHDADALAFRITVVDPGVERGAVNGARLSAALGSTLHLPCTSTAAPDAAVTWVSPEHAILPPSAGNKRVFANGTLRIHGVTERDVGYFRCVAANRYGADLLVFQVLVRQDETALEKKHGALGEWEEGSGSELLPPPAHSQPAATPATLRAHGESAASAASSQGTQSTHQSNSHGKMPHRPYGDRAGRRFRGHRRQFVSSGRRADPQRWAALLEKTKRNLTVTDKRGEVATEPPVQVRKLSEVPEDEEETSGDLISPEEEFMIPVTHRSPVPALGRATELTITAGPKETTNPTPAWSTSLLLTEPLTLPHSVTPASKRLQTLPKPTDSWQRSDLSQISADGVKLSTVPSGTSTLFPAGQKSMYSGESNNQHLKPASVTPTAEAPGSSKAVTPQNTADKLHIFTELTENVSTKTDHQVSVVTVNAPSSEFGPVYFHSAQKGGTPNLPLASTFTTHQQNHIIQDVPTDPPQLQQHYGRRRKISGRRRIVRPGHIPSMKEHRHNFGRPGSARGGIAVATGVQLNVNYGSNGPTLNNSSNSINPFSPEAPQPSPSTMNMPLEHPVGTHQNSAFLREEEEKRSARQKAAPTVTPVTAKGTATAAASGLGVMGLKPTAALANAPQTDTRVAKRKTLRVGGRRGQRRKRPPKTPVPQRAAAAHSSAATPAASAATPTVTALTPPAVPASLAPPKPLPGSVSAAPRAKAAVPGTPDSPEAAQHRPTAATPGTWRSTQAAAASLPGGVTAQSAAVAPQTTPGTPGSTHPATSPAASPAQTPTKGLQTSPWPDEPPGARPAAVRAASGPVTAEPSAATAAAGENPDVKPGQGTVREGPAAQPTLPARALPRAPAAVTAPGPRNPRPGPARTTPGAPEPPAGHGQLQPRPRPRGTGRGNTLQPPLSAAPWGRDKDSPVRAWSGRRQDQDTTTVPDPIASASASRNHFSKPRIAGGKLAAFTVLANSDALIPCEATGNPPPTIEWTKIPSGSDAAGPGSGGRRWAALPNGTLSIPRAGLQDRGQYLCTAANPHGAARLLVTLAVLARPPRVSGGRSLTAHSGSSASLPCRAQGSPAPRISWLLANGTRLSHGSAGGGRAGVEPDGTLVIRAVSVYDRGLYTCLAENPAGTDTLAVKLQVVAAPPTVLEEKRQSVAGTAGESLELPCTAQGQPRPSVHWVLPDGRAVKPLQPVRPGLLLLPDGTLRLGSAAPSDSGTYECIATSSTGSDRRVVSLVVQRRDALPKIAVASQELTRLNFGERLLLNCTASGEPKPRIIWRLPSKAVVDQWHRMGSRIHVYPNGSLAIEAVTEKDAGDYLCVARNRIGDDLVLMKVSITMKPAKIDHKQQFKKLVPYGKDFRVDCKASGSPTPEISWGLPDGTVVNNAMLADDSGRRARRYVLFDNGTLYLNRAGVAEGGDYTCYAQNTLGRDEMKVHVTVIVAAPQIKHNYQTHVTVTAGDAALLDCEAAGEPRAQIFWLLPSSEMISSSTERHSLHANGSLSIGHASLLDAGEYMCVARNPGGDDTKLYKLDVAAKPPVINGLYRNKTVMKVTAVRHSKKHIDCRAEGSPPPQIMWIMPDNIFLTAPYYGSRIVVHKNGTLEIRNIRPSDAADFICVARNDGGESVLVVQLEVTEMLRRPMFKNPFNEKIIAKPGKTVTLNCSVDGNPPPEISWMLPNGTWFPSSVRTSQFLTGSDGTLTIPNPEGRHAGRYRCAARNQVGYIEKLVVLEVAQKPSILTRPAGLVKGVSGEPLSLHCLAQGSPKPRVAWTLPGGRVLERPQVSGRHLLLENGTLLIRAASAQDAGNYVCRAHNDAGDSSLSTAVVVAAYAPRIVGRPPPAIHTVPGAPVQLHCVVLGIPKPEISWELPDRSVLSTAHQGRGSGGELLHATGTLLLQNPRASSSGAYKCTARNPLGTDTAVTYVHVI
ncbi:immunoglobulin superfamily member 10 [Hirundo rustica]|nr:immunoglobulin superfamily member 10 [Hirundo rustica]